MRTLKLFFEAFNYCPMRCPCCSQGRREYASNGEAFSPESLDSILSILNKQANIGEVDLFNLGEPLLNRRLPELVTVAKGYSNRVVVSTAGNHVACDLGELVVSDPHVLIVSASGNTEAIYQQTHKGGSIEKTKQFVKRMLSLGCKRLCIVFHRYRHNLHEESDLKAWAKSMGVPFIPTWAIHLHIEALQSSQDNPYLIVPISEQLQIAKRQKDYKCCLIENGLLFDPRGDLRSCAFSGDLTTFGNVFEEPLETIIHRKATTNPLCVKCYETGAYKVCSSQNIIIDRECARRVKAGPIRKCQWFIERMRKHIWTYMEINRNA